MKEYSFQDKRTYVFPTNPFNARLLSTGSQRGLADKKAGGNAVGAAEKAMNEKPPLSRNAKGPIPTSNSTKHESMSARQLSRLTPNHASGGVLRENFADNADHLVSAVTSPKDGWTFNGGSNSDYRRLYQNWSQLLTSHQREYQNDRLPS